MAAALKYRKSWTAYLIPGAGFVIVAVLGGAVVRAIYSMSESAGGGSSLLATVSALLWLLLLAFMVIRLLAVRSVVLFAD